MGKRIGQVTRRLRLQKAQGYELARGKARPDEPAAFDEVAPR
jgi:hypothetical protein